MYFTVCPIFLNCCTIYSIEKKNLFGEGGLLLKALTFSFPSIPDVTSVSHTNCIGSHLRSLPSCTVPHTISVSWMHQSVAQFWHLYPSRSYPNYTGNKKALISFFLSPSPHSFTPLSPTTFFSLFSIASKESHLYPVDSLHTTFDGPLSRSACVWISFCSAHSSLMHSSASQMLEAL